MIKIFLDTEFTGLTQDAELISLALVAESGEEFYAEFTDFKRENLNTWVIENVISRLNLTANNLNRSLEKMHVRGNKSEIKSAIQIWFHQFGEKKDEMGNTIPHLQIWGDVPHYDWVLFCELFGGALNIPPVIHYMPMDLATLLWAKGFKPDMPRGEISGNVAVDNLMHNALHDARAGMEILKKLLRNG